MSPNFKDLIHPSCCFLMNLESQKPHEIDLGMPFLKKLYPRAHDNRLPKNDPVVKKARRAFFTSAGINFLYLQVLFLGLFCYIFGALFQQGTHTHNLRVAFVDYDGGAIGRAVRAAYASLQGDSFPSLVERSPLELQTTDDVLRAVCETKYWAAVYVTQGASRRLEEALAAESVATAYDKTDVLAYVWNEALYAPIIDAAISSNMQLLSGAARIAYSAVNGTGNIRSVSGPAALSVLADPWTLQSVNIQPTSQGSRAIYNTVVIILILIQEFFYLGTINGLYAQFKLYARVNPTRIIVVRILTSLTYTFIGSLCVIGTIWAFKSGWDINGNQFVLSWMTFWLFAHTNFLIFDVFTIWLPPPFVPMALVSWIIFSVTSILLPFDLSPAFYRLGYMLPAHEVYQVLTDIWSHGCNPQLHYALPVLFAWEVVSLMLSILGVYRRSHYATLGEERQAKELQERIDAAVAFERDKETKHSAAHPEPEKRLKKFESTGDEPSEPQSDTDNITGAEDEEAYREELAQVISRVTTRQRRDKGRADETCNFGPSFNLPYGKDNEDGE
ncbi:hypothetical protein B0H63DRAFT_474293 [Podospora didyma]|uniref:DUF3533 domain-containing protein n=1 Tax=Podospora didyma TaxID=330526 RepID=A0AAE0U0C3_9PEZI|nr:hypothetical protein B0H63DRAFT_474293 [Podospora didyma]